MGQACSYLMQALAYTFAECNRKVLVFAVVGRLSREMERGCEADQPGGFAGGQPGGLAEKSGNLLVAMKSVRVSAIVSMGSCPRNFSVR